MKDEDRLEDLAASLETGNDPRVAPLHALLGDESVWAEPTPGLEERILAATEDARQGDGAVASGPGTDSQPAAPSHGPRVAPVTSLAHRRRRYRNAAAGLVAVAASIAAFLLLTAAPPVATVHLAGTQLAPQARAVATIEDDAGGWLVELEVRGLAPAPDGHYYQGWQSHGERSISIGTFHLRGGDDVIPLWSGVPVGEYPDVFVTLESVAAPPGPSEQRVLEGRAISDR